MQGLCVYHSIRKGTQAKWLWLIIILPMVGCIIYFFSEIVKKKHFSAVQENIQQVANPGGRLKELEKNFRFSDTFANRAALADAYLEAGQADKAIALYEPGLTGIFRDNEHAIKQLIAAYYRTGNYEKACQIAPRLSRSYEFSKTPANLYYALSLEKIGYAEKAEKEFEAMNHRFSNYEARYCYGEFLIRQNKKQEAALLLHEIVEESKRMTRQEKGASRQWIGKAEALWKSVMSEYA